MPVAILKKLGRSLVIALTMSGAVAATTTPASAWWCRWGCGGGPLAAGLIGGLAVGTLVGAAARPYYGPAPYYYYPPPPGAVLACPPGYHLGPQGRACWPG